MFKYVYWEMENGKQHGFCTEMENWRDEDEGVPDTTHDIPIKTQGDYADATAYLCDTEIYEVCEYPWTHEGLKEAVEAGHIRIMDYDPRYDNEPEDFEKLAASDGVETPNWGW